MTDMAADSDLKAEWGAGRSLPAPACAPPSSAQTPAAAGVRAGAGAGCVRVVATRITP